MMELTIQIPDDLARSLEEIAAAQHKSLGQVALERLSSTAQREGSPAAVRRAVRQPPHVDQAIVDELEAAIAAARLPVRNQGAFNL